MSHTQRKHEQAPGDWTEADVHAAIVRSGYLLEQRVETVLLAAGYEVHASRRVPDNETGKVREMDLLAEKRELQTIQQAKERPAVDASLIIECINSRLPLVFFEKPITWTESYPVRTLLGVPLFVPDAPNSSGFYLLEDEAGVSWQRTITHWATQYCGFEEKHGKDRRLEATQHNDHHGTFDKLIAESERCADGVMNEALIVAGWMGGWLTLVRPVVVLQGRLLAATVQGETVSLTPRDHIHYLRRGMFKDRRVAWVVDIVTEAGLPAYLLGISKTLDKVRTYCMTQRDAVQEALKSESTRRMSLTARGYVR
jgi:hypothetical protein